MYVPRDYAPVRLWPTILFLHGAGERGSDGLKQTQVGLGTAIRTDPKRFPALVVMPQCAEGDWWTSPLMKRTALKALARTIRSYSVDEDRLYLTGLSMGGYGSWAIAAEQPERFAAVVPICGGGDPATTAPRVRDLPIWAFHGDADTVVVPDRSRTMVEAVRAAGGTRVRYTEYAGVGHNSWDPAYAEAEMLEWLFSQRRAGALKPGT